jgi:hypothetical protein
MRAMVTLPGLTGCGLGSPERVVKMLTTLGVSTPWMATYTAGEPHKESTMHMKRCLGVISVVATGFALVATALAQDGSYSTARAPATAKVNETGAALRDLWVGHVFWVRNVVVSTFAGNTAATAAAEQEVVANAKQIAAAIEPYYGKDASERLFGLLAGHYGAVKHYLEATVGGKRGKQDVAFKSLSANATEIARFLSEANPNLPFGTLNGLLLAHGGHHVQQIQQVQSKLYAEEAQTWETMKRHMYVIADALAGAIAKQFPKQFS